MSKTFLIGWFAFAVTVLSLVASTLPATVYYAQGTNPVTASGNAVGFSTVWNSAAAGTGSYAAWAGGANPLATTDSYFANGKNVVIDAGMPNPWIAVQIGTLATGGTFSLPTSGSATLTVSNTNGFIGNTAPVLTLTTGQNLTINGQVSMLASGGYTGLIILNSVATLTVTNTRSEEHTSELQS